MSGAVGCVVLLAAVATGSPAEFERLPRAIRSRATLVVSGAYEVAKGPDERLPDGRTRWPLLHGFTKKTVYRGKVAADYIGIEVRHVGQWENGELVEGREYLLVLRPSAASWKLLSAQKRSWNWRDALSKQEVLAIVPLE